MTPIEKIPFFKFIKTYMYVTEKIPLVKAVRELVGVGLIEAKNIVENELDYETFYTKHQNDVDACLRHFYKWYENYVNKYNAEIPVTIPEVKLAFDNSEIESAITLLTNSWKILGYKNPFDAIKQYAVRQAKNLQSPG
jgi:esterase/lipase superfamily enzyme